MCTGCGLPAARKEHGRAVEPVDDHQIRLLIVLDGRADCFKILDHVAEQVGIRLAEPAVDLDVFEVAVGCVARQLVRLDEAPEPRAVGCTRGQAFCVIDERAGQVPMRPEDGSEPFDHLVVGETAVPFVDDPLHGEERLGIDDRIERAVRAYQRARRIDHALLLEFERDAIPHVVPDVLLVRQDLVDTAS